MWERSEASVHQTEHYFHPESSRMQEVPSKCTVVSVTDPPSGYLLLRMNGLAAPTDSAFTSRSGLPVHHVVTGSSVLAGLAGTLVDIKLTVGAGKPGQTLAGVHASQVMTGGSVAAGAGLTLVYLSLTVDSW